MYIELYRRMPCVNGFGIDLARRGQVSTADPCTRVARGVCAVRRAAARFADAARACSVCGAWIRGIATSELTTAFAGRRALIYPKRN